jgi:hypothetical protein
MGRRLRTGLVALGTLLVAALLTSGAAQAQGEPSITVTPSTGLQDGQTVTVTGSGFSPDVTAIGLAQCEAPNSCSGQTVVPASGGSFSATFTVTRFVLGTDCAESPGRCLLGASNLNGDGGAFNESDLAPLSFGPDVPQSKSDCKHGGWKNLADDEGRPFRNQGQCVSFVVHQR